MLKFLEYITPNYSALWNTYFELSFMVRNELCLQKKGHQQMLMTFFRENDLYAFYKSSERALAE